MIPPHAPTLRVQRGDRRLAPRAGQHARRQLAEAVGLLQDAVVHALSCREGHDLGLGRDAGEVGRAAPCKWAVLQGWGGGGGGWAGGGGGRCGRHGGRRGVPETAAAAARVGGAGALRSLAEQQQLLARDLAVRGLRAGRAGAGWRLAAEGRVERVGVGAAVLSRFSEGQDQTEPVKQTLIACKTLHV